jgi:hypothetical protein
MILFPELDAQLQLPLYTPLFFFMRLDVSEALEFSGQSGSLRAQFWSNVAAPSSALDDGASSSNIWSAQGELVVANPSEG